MVQYPALLAGPRSRISRARRGPGRDGAGAIEPDPQACAVSLLYEDPVDQVQGAVGPRGEIGIVGDDDQAGTDAAIELEHQIEDLPCRTAIEIARRLVSEHARRSGDQCARQGDALALAAGELA